MPPSRAGEEFEWDRCRTYEANWSHVLLTMQPPDRGTPTVPCQNGWEFELSDIPYQTVVSEVREKTFAVLDILYDTSHWNERFLLHLCNI